MLTFGPTTPRSDSEEERQDVLEAYEMSKGDLETMFTFIPCSEVLEDEERFVKLISEAIKAGDIKELPQWKKSVKDESGRKKMRAKARKEASEAEEYAKELGVWDDLFGKKKKDSDSGARTQIKRPKVADDEEVEVEGDASSDEDEDDDDEEDAAPVQKKRKVKKTKDTDKSASSSSKRSSKSTSNGKKASSSKNTASSSKGKGKKQQDEDDDEGLDGLRALMMKRGSERSQGFDAMIARMEAQAGGSKKGGKKGPKPPPMFDDPLGDDEPDEAAFMAARAKIDANKKKADAGKSSSSSKRKSR